MRLARTQQEVQVIEKEVNKRKSKFGGKADGEKRVHPMAGGIE